MDLRIDNWSLLVFVLLLAGNVSCRIFHAKFNMNGETGYVTFEQPTKSSDVTIKSNLNTFNDSYWFIKHYPAIFSGGVKYTCPNDKLGVDIVALGQHNASFTKDVNSITLYGRETILGRTLLLTSNSSSSSAIGCAVILPESPAIYATASFSNNKIGGQIAFLGTGIEEVLITGLLYTTREQEYSKKTWQIINEDLINEKECPSFQNTTIFDPNSSRGPCLSSNTFTCQVGDLSGKHDDVPVGRISKKLEQLRYIDENLGLSGNHSIIGKVLVIKDNANQKILGCSRIMRAGPLEVESRFNAELHQGISGYFKFTQDSPYHPTKVKIDLSGLDNRTNGYHIHKFAISDRHARCSPLSVGGHHNPYGMSAADAPSVNTTSCDKYEIGDLSSRFGTLNGKDNFTLDVEDWNTPLFGKYSSVGRSIVIHRNNEKGTRFVCQDLTPPNSKVMKGKLDFSKSSHLQGAAYFVQFIQENGVYTQTLITMNIRYTNHSRKTYGHHWHLTEVSVQGDQMVDVGRCRSAGGPYNPTNISIGNPSETECGPDYPRRCEVGGTSLKHMNYDIGTSKKIALSDVYTPMFGEDSILGRGLTVLREEEEGSSERNTVTETNEEGSSGGRPTGGPRTPGGGPSGRRSTPGPNGGGPSGGQGGEGGLNRHPPRLACADIIPVESAGAVKVQYDIQDRSLIKKINPLKKQIASAMGFGSNNWKIVYLKTSNIPGGPGTLNLNCFRVSFFILDDSTPQNAAALKTRFENVVKEEQSKLGQFQPCSACSLISSLLLLLSCVISAWELSCMV